MRMVKESIKNKETKIRVIGEINSNILEDYQDGKFTDSKKVTLNEFLNKLGFYTGKTWVKCKSNGCNSLVSAQKSNKKYCRQCAAKTKKEDNRKWIKEHKDKQNEYQRSYQREYQRKNKENTNKYKENFLNKYKGLFVYFLVNKENEIKYIGQTKNIYTRSIAHLSGNVPATRDFVASKDFKCIVYKNLVQLLAEEELKKLESYLLNNTKAELLNENTEEVMYRQLTEKEKEVFGMLNLDIENMIEWV
ncbi:GIY-YIG nuclease family protein [Clostridium perfringens]|nr:GIY-YIG nuclease family protein [Clostridium perfringens]